MPNSFIMTLVAASAASALIEGFLPESGMKKYVKYLIALIIAVILASPFPGILKGLANSEIATDAAFYDSVEVYSRANSIVARRIKKSICDKFALPESETEVLYKDGSIYANIPRSFGVFLSDIRLYIVNSFGITAEVSFIE